MDNNEKQGLVTDKLKVGDKVVYIGPEDTRDSRRIGTVIEINLSRNLPVTVEWNLYRDHDYNFDGTQFDSTVYFRKATPLEELL